MYAKVLWNQLKEYNKSKVKLNGLALRVEMSAVRLSDCKNVQEYASNIQSYVNDFNVSTDTDSSSTGSGTMTNSQHAYYQMKGIPKDDDWRVFTQLMYNKIDTLADKPEQFIEKMNVQEARLQKEANLEEAAMLTMLQTKSEKRILKQIRKFRMSHYSGSWSDGSSSDSEKYTRCCTNWRDTLGCYRCHKVGHIAQYCPSIAPVESGAPTDTGPAAKTMTTTSSENNWMTAMNGESPPKESCYLDCDTTAYICGDQRESQHYSEYTMWEEREIRDFAGAVTDKTIGYADVRIRFWLPGYCRNHEVVVRKVLHIEGTHNSLLQLWHIDRQLQIMPVNGYGIKIYDKLPTDSAHSQSRGWGRGSLVGMACEIGGLLQLDVKLAGKRYRARG